MRGTKDTKILESWHRSEVWARGKSKSVKYWTALGRCLVSKGLLKEIKQHMQGGGGGGFGAFNKKSYMGFGISVAGNKLLNDETASLMLKTTGDLVERKAATRVKPVLISPRFGVEQTPEDSVRTRLYALLVAERKQLAQG